MPRSFSLFTKQKFYNDKIEKALADFLNCPSFQLLFPLIRLEADAWENFARQPSQISDREQFFLRLKNQRSTDREPCIQSIAFLPHSYICRTLYRLAQKPPRYYHAEPYVDFGTLFQLLRDLPHFSRNLVHEIITFSNLGTEQYIYARKAQKRLINSSWKTYQSALNQLAEHLRMSFQIMYFKLLELPSPIADRDIYNFLIHSADSQRWINNRSVAVLSGLKALARVNHCQRFDTPFWSKCMKEIKKSGITKRTKNVALIEEKNFNCEFAMQIWFQAKLHGTKYEAGVCQFCPLTGQRVIDYNSFLPSDGVLQESEKRFRALWQWGKKRSDEYNMQFTYIPYGEPGTFYDIKSCWLTIIENWPPNNTYVFSFKNETGTRITADKIIKKFAAMVPVKLRSFPPDEVSLYFYKNMMTDFLSRTDDLHPQIGGHYLKHAVSNEGWRKNTMEKFGKTAHMWFSPITLRYALKVSHLAKIKKEFQRIWDQIYFEQRHLLEKMWKAMGFNKSFMEQVKETKEAMEKPATLV